MTFDDFAKECPWRLEIDGCWRLAIDGCRAQPMTDVYWARGDRVLEFYECKQVNCAIWKLKELLERGD